MQRFLNSNHINLIIQRFSLRVALTNNSLEWVQDFGNKGLKQVCFNSPENASKPCSAGAVGPQRMLQKRFKMGQSATRVRTRIFKKKKIDFCFNQVYQMLEGHHEQQGGLEEFVRAQGGAHTSGKVCSLCYDCSHSQRGAHTAGSVCSSLLGLFTFTLLTRCVRPSSVLESFTFTPTSGR